MLDAILPLRVWDTHTHLIGQSLPAKTIWDILHYFWFLRELQAAGYPARPDSIPEAERPDIFLKAFDQSRNTSMNWVVRQIFKQLYHVQLKDRQSIVKADRLVRETSKDPAWPQVVCDKLNITDIVTNDQDHVHKQGFPNHAVPRLEAPLGQWVEKLVASSDRLKEGLSITEDIQKILARFASQGCKGVMTSSAPFGRLCKRTVDLPALETNSTKDDISVFILHALCRAAQEQGLFVQFFLGVETTWGVNQVPSYHPDRILNLYGLFKKYDCQFDLVLASHLNNLDAVQAARIFSHVHVGGLWWYNFQASTYRDAMQYRIEALPPHKCSLVASDARCIEWCFGKVLLVKHLLVEFLEGQVKSGWIDRDEAIRVAEMWLYNGPAGLYKKAVK